jgi:hypothetical protein
MSVALADDSMSVIVMTRPLTFDGRRELVAESLLTNGSMRQPQKHDDRGTISHHSIPTVIFAKVRPD